ncbi:hypothetical protein DHL47_06765 [Streptococcus panodentis]|uniref:Uncharacterized protein n=1 Tax=Streptococcus panodentis TaxID=1581472 RepID=A0ABS5AXN9_9STRE|nr:hypothetical protein [Streptococcus panodentis]
MPAFQISKQNRTAQSDVDPFLWTMNTGAYKEQSKAVGQTPMMAAPSPTEGWIFWKIPYKN